MARQNSELRGTHQIFFILAHKIYYTKNMFSSFTPRICSCCELAQTNIKLIATWNIICGVIRNLPGSNHTKQGIRSKPPPSLKQVFKKISPLFRGGGFLLRERVFPNFWPKNLAKILSPKVRKSKLSDTWHCYTCMSDTSKSEKCMIWHPNVRKTSKNTSFSDLKCVFRTFFREHDFPISKKPTPIVKKKPTRKSKVPFLRGEGVLLWEGGVCVCVEGRVVEGRRRVFTTNSRVELFLEIFAHAILHIIIRSFVSHWCDYDVIRGVCAIFLAQMRQNMRCSNQANHVGLCNTRKNNSHMFNFNCLARRSAWFF